MRLAAAIVLLLGLPAVATAQRGAHVPSGRSSAPPSIGLPLPSIGLPLPQIGLPLPEIGLPRPATGLPPVETPARHAPRVDRFGARTSRPHSAPIYVIPAYVWPLAESPDNSEKPLSENSVSAPQPLVGGLRLDVAPTGTQQELYVDGKYVGTFKDFSGEMELDAGPHVIDIEAPGFETLHFDVNISPGRSFAYRGSLTATPPSAPPATSGPTTPATPPTIYIIPGCYVGNVPPQDVDLPASCDKSRVVTRHP